VPRLLCEPLHTTRPCVSCRHRVICFVYIDSVRYQHRPARYLFRALRASARRAPFCRGRLTGDVVSPSYGPEKHERRGVSEALEHAPTAAEEAHPPSSPPSELPSGCLSRTCNYPNSPRGQDCLA
jgi:hypothetical protein